MSTIIVLPEGWVVSVDTPDEVEIVILAADKESRGHYVGINFGSRLGSMAPRVHTRGATVEAVEAALALWHSRPRENTEQAEPSQ